MKTAAEFHIQYQQFIDESAKAIQDLPDFASDNNTLIELYRAMLLTRLFDSKGVAMQRTGSMGTFPSSRGQEAVSVAVGHAMQADDILAPYYRDQGAQFERGVSLHEVYSYWGGDERGMCFENQPYDFPACVPIASQCLHAAGAAFAIKYRQEQRVVVTTIGEGGTSEGDFYEAMNVAGAWQLPLVFVVNNNQWAISVPRAEQTYTQTIAQKAIAAGFTGIQVDGNDVIAVREVVANAIENARQGNGPTLVEAICYRLCDHTTADDATRYTDASIVSEAEKHEPIRRLKNYMTANGFWSDAQEQALQTELKNKVQQDAKKYMNKEKQPIESMFDFMFESLPEALLEQRESLQEQNDV